MDKVRLRRLKADHDALRRLAHLHPRIAIEGTYGNPPERYRLKLTVRSLRERGEVIEPITEHKLEITLPRGYPRDAPLFRMLTPVFHPNIAPHAVCIGDDWTAGEPLDHLVQRVGEILAFQSYNVKSPLNGRAAQWVEEHVSELPVDREEFFLDRAAVPPTPSELCSSCGSWDVTLAACGGSHQLCNACTVKCPTCAKLLCRLCGVRTCAACQAATFAARAADRTRCTNCGAATPAGGAVCSADHNLCGDCSITCRTCAATLCLVCNTYPCRTCASAARSASP